MSATAGDPLLWSYLLAASDPDGDPPTYTLQMFTLVVSAGCSADQADQADHH